MFLGTLLVNTFFSMVTSGLIYFFLNINFSHKVTRNRLYTYVICFGFLNGIVSSVWMEFVILPIGLQLLKSIALLILSILTIKIILMVDWLKAVLSFFVIALTVSIGNFLTPVLFSILKIDVTTKTIAVNLPLYLFVNVSIYVIASSFIFVTPLVKNFGKTKNLKPISFLLGITFLIVCINMCVHYVAHFDTISFLMVLITSFAYLAASTWYISKYQKYELKLEEQKQQAFYNESLTLALKDLRRFKHDQANHLSVINAMLHMNKYSDAKSYLKEIVATTESLANTAIFNIKNAGLFGIISSKMDKADKLGVNFELKTIGIVDSIPNIKISELCEVVGIYLDNALEAADKASNNKSVEMLVMGTDVDVNITVKNSCGSIPIMSKIKIDGYSSKGNDRGHGLSIAENILQKHTDILNIIQFDNESMQFVQILKIKKGI